ncbi:hypothetical protein Airi02_030100 [Actinoallomurus iriomotensis]|uniref:Uncharacterized protein n=1 Tax=Actinoallomurus iriomotensis TaxID=478107 RepID=A0A9W6S0J7_9ACTN|nr:hypothetical protein Airi02_030100 [Actinoallomurus iriomotensis]
MLTRASGVATTASTTRPSQSANRPAVSASKTSAATVTAPRNPPAAPSSPKTSEKVTSRSNLATTAPHRSDTPADARTPGRSSSAGVLFCSVTITWNSGCRASDRTGANSSTRRSNGTS